MSDVQELRESFLNAFPAAALLLWQDRIVAVNGAVRRRLPQLEPGEPIPPELLALSGVEAQPGVFYCSAAAVEG